ncbi:MAG: class IV adenylate cyclase [Anaerolineae bacterium]|nr:class IV adenylate cyclase [Anaerolineae bacterium]
MSDHSETEVKLHVPDLDGLAARLVAAGAALHSPRTHEHNVRYDTPGGDLSRQYIVLRLRQDARVRLTYKGPAQVTEGVMSRYEAEVTVDDFATMDGILRALGYAPFAIYEKYRTTYRWGEAEIVLDELPFGNFCEIEGPLPAIHAALAALGLQDRPRIPTSYLGVFAVLKGRLGLTFRDLTFANFAGIVVPPEVFNNLT